MSDTAPPRVVVVGSANADLVLDIDRRPAPGETILSADLVTTPGGKGANQAVAAARAEGDVAFVGCVGDDGHGRLLRDSLTSAGVDVEALRIVDAPSGTATIMVTPDGENSIVVSPAANRHLTVSAADEVSELWISAAVVVLQLEIPVDTVSHIARGAHAAGARVVLNAAPAAPLEADVLATADPLVVNESEAEFLLSQNADEDAAPLAQPVAMTSALLDLGPRTAVLTLGSRGSVAAWRGPDGTVSTAHVPARKVRAIDTTGAGDGFVGALAVRLAAGDALPEAVELASRFAAVAVTRRGAQASYPNLAEVPE